MFPNGDFGLKYEAGDGTVHRLRPPFQVEDILWVRETWAKSDNGFLYKADKIFDSTEVFDCNWKPSIHMPKSACRLKL